MSSSGRNTAPVVSRKYSPAPDDCARALEILLKAPIRTEGGLGTTPDYDAKELKNDCAVTKHYTQP
jgi:hypothetical protein